MFPVERSIQLFATVLQEGEPFTGDGEYLRIEIGIDDPLSFPRTGKNVADWQETVELAPGETRRVNVDLR